MTRTMTTPRRGTRNGRIAAWVFCFTLVGIGGCASGDRERHFAARSDVVLPDPGDGRTRVSVWPKVERSDIAAGAFTPAGRAKSDDTP